jgi:putative transposase
MFLRKSEKRLAKEQGKLSRKEKESGNHRKQRSKVARVHLWKTSPGTQAMLERK